MYTLRGIQANVRAILARSNTDPRDEEQFIPQHRCIHGKYTTGAIQGAVKLVLQFGGRHRSDAQPPRKQSRQDNSSVASWHSLSALLERIPFVNRSNQCL